MNYFKHFELMNDECAIKIYHYNVHVYVENMHSNSLLLSVFSLFRAIVHCKIMVYFTVQIMCTAPWICLTFKVEMNICYPYKV